MKDKITITHEELVTAHAKTMCKLLAAKPQMILIADELTAFAALTCSLLFKEDKEDKEN